MPMRGDRAVLDAGKADSKDRSIFAMQLISPLSGVGAGVVCTLVCSPLDVLKTRFQVQGALAREGGSAAKHPYGSMLSAVRAVWAEEGLKGFYRGLGPALVTVPIFWGMYFPVYEGLKARLRGSKESLSNAEIVASAMGAGFVVDIATNPLWVVRTRMQTQHMHERMGAGRSGYGSITAAVATILRTDGFWGLWRGVTASFLGLAHVAVQFPIYEYMKKRSRDAHGGKETSADLVAASAVSKVCASAVSYPHEVLRARLQDSSKELGASGLVRTTVDLVRNEGWKTLYTGFRVNLVRVIPSCVTTFVTYELLSSYLKGVIAGARAEG